MFPIELGLMCCATCFSFYPSKQYLSSSVGLEEPVVLSFTCIWVCFLSFSGVSSGVARYPTCAPLSENMSMGCPWDRDPVGLRHLCNSRSLLWGQDCFSHTSHIELNLTGKEHPDSWSTSLTSRTLAFGEPWVHMRFYQFILIDSFYILSFLKGSVTPYQ